MCIHTHALGGRPICVCMCTCVCKNLCVNTHTHTHIHICTRTVILILVAFITGNSSLEPLIEGLYAQIHVNLR